jgi:hypothetical protein
VRDLEAELLAFWRDDAAEWRKRMHAYERNDDDAEPELTTATCVACGEKFERATSRHKYCSDRCREGHGTKPPQPRPCPICRKPFTPPHPLTKVCSTECARERARRTTREQYRRRQLGA